eukprot:c32437_g1_i1.p1 GENE.c32437_g1_i1~~c32437_g1_i1.p1  ORF type:complete len:334 (+),score=70.46 c32437_g1_i1:39-1040(+)
MAAEQRKGVKPEKAYRNPRFINSREARTIRIICEFEETPQRLREENVKETIMFFGSARAKDRQQYAAALADAEQRLANARTDQEKASAEANLKRVHSSEWMCEVVETTIELSRRLTEWAMHYRSNDVVGGGFLSKSTADGRKRVTYEDGRDGADEEAAPKQSLMVCTGGGPGLMEAANHGSSLVPGAKSIGMGITLPFEATLNPYVTPELAFEYHYFFTRKYWMLFPCRALIVAPGGFGTMDELFEVMTLKETGKIKIDMPVVLLGKQYWNKVLNLEAAVKYGTIKRSAYETLFFTDSVDEAFEFVTRRILELRESDAHTVDEPSRKKQKHGQ